MEDIASFRQLSNADLAAVVVRFAHDERTGTARSARKLPRVLDRLRDGSLSLTNLCLLARHLTEANHAALLEEAAGKRKSEVQRIVTRLRPQPDVPSAVRKVRTPRISSQPQTVSPASAADARETPGLAAAAAVAQLEPAAPVTEVLFVPSPPKPAVIAPLAPGRYRIQITVDQGTHDVLRQAQDLMRHSNPSGDPAVVISRALRVLVEDLLKKKAAATDRPRPGRDLADGSRVVPAAVKREVWLHDDGRCTFEGSRGRCSERGCLEYHHVIPYAMGGEAVADNIELRCRAHNAYQARLDGLAIPPQSSG